MSKDYWAGPNARGWQVKGGGNERATSVHETQAAAWNEARARAKDAGGEAYLQNRHGQIRERNTYGHDPESSKG
jgi:hypothetical protein